MDPTNRRYMSLVFAYARHRLLEPGHVSPPRNICLLSYGRAYRAGGARPGLYYVVKGPYLQGREWKSARW